MFRKNGKSSDKSWNSTRYSISTSQIYPGESSGISEVSIFVTVHSNLP